MIYHEVTDGFTVYFSLESVKKDLSDFQMKAFINPYNYMSGGVECVIKVVPKRNMSDAINRTDVSYEVVSATHFCSEPQKGHIADMQMAFHKVEELGKKLERKIKSLLPEANDHRAVLTALSEKDYLSVMVLMGIRDFNASISADKDCDEWLKNIVSHKSFTPILDAFKGWDRKSKISDPELQMCINFAGHLIKSDLHRGCAATKRTSLDDDLGGLFALAGIDYSEVFKRFTTVKKEIAAVQISKDEQVESPLPWHMK